MEFKSMPKIEMIEKSRERLSALEKEGKYVFHGSPNIVEALEPRQAGGHNEKTGKWENDGNPALYASPYADCAIFRSLIYGKELENEIGINDDNQLHFATDRKLLERAKNKIGRVYVFEKSKFKDFRGMDCRSEETLKPIEIIEVTTDDLPHNVKIIEEEV